MSEPVPADKSLDGIKAMLQMEDKAAKLLTTIDRIFADRGRELGESINKAVDMNCPQDARYLNHRQMETKYCQTLIAALGKKPHD